MHRRIGLFVAASAVVTMLNAGAARAQASSMASGGVENGSVTAAATCNRATLNSSYGMLGWGAGSSLSAGYAAVGKASFDGVGNVVATFFQNPPPFGQHISCSGTYKVHTDCTASVTFNAGSCTNGDPFQMTIVDNGARIFMLAAQSTQLPLVFLLDRIQ
jgi:hypothetical protein